MSGRHRWSVLAWIVLLVCSAARAEGGLTIATWNVENYVAEDRLVEKVYRPDYPKPEAAKTALRQAIREMDADVLALQEMGPEPYLIELQRDLEAEGLSYPHRAWVDGPDPKRHLAVLSRVALRERRSHAKLWHRRCGELMPVSRGVLEVAVDDGAGGWLRLFLVHLKSRHTSDPADPESARQRAGEAEAVRDLVLARCAEPARDRFMILGDCNDVPTSRPLRALLFRGDLAITLLRDAGDDRGDSWTHCFRRQATYSRVDYILPSPAADNCVRKMWIHDTAAVRGASDHRPVLVQWESPPREGDWPARR